MATQMSLEQNTVPDGFYGEVKGPWWDDRPVVIVAGGPSLRGFDWEQLRGFHVLAVKGSIFDIPWADAGFGLDMPRFEEWREKLAQVSMTVYWAVPVEQAIITSRPSQNMTFLKRINADGVSSDPTLVFSGGTSGFGALQIALLKRAKRIMLVGYDYNPSVTGIHAHNQRAMVPFRHNDQHYRKRRAQNFQNWKKWAGNFALFRPYCERWGIEIINACENSGITTFPRIPLDAAVGMMQTW